ncbi:2-oxoglutarate dehydrogenase E1 component [Shewanella sp. 1_MG-2023]|uniref:2-oxoglutarate dehydrogenase E1 component n=1 Tax=unclassified Shewanella TaxID=196818 RepID=UPI000C84B2EA|nr:MULTISPECIES: 2-oxoglutarate dehydrogenase E1 component [unclassified Shewanella]MCC4832393.1 2-oxoglutarate dehydrogenase E1 component [Shewanella sp. 10N.7]MDO6610831.1 2-oxoglutarate dehydrogenase E1 component [Shewanella sp. 7_MG-2023]MDO6770318.1 2-oxoglutarate dehydrogenase E1 component [Shewanella sp. 2_MG-2023]MDO6793459.1 2-oxoglutarate dehydrogenase E1 component [Shewanella sp. 1_MG-2023]PMG75916.1 2-oxoglutarate dehydrogenase E1 component [Shewanella sp. 10N.286.51.B7]
MHQGIMKAWLESSHLSGSNSTYVEEMYEAYQEDPSSVSADWQVVFDNLPAVNGTSQDIPEAAHSKVRDYFRSLALESRAKGASRVTDPELDAKQVKVLQLINAHRFRGHQNANLDPLGLWQREAVQELNPAFHGLDAEDMLREFNTGSFAYGSDTLKLADIVHALKSTYCGSIGAEYMHITDTDEKRWIQQRLEPSLGKANYDNSTKKRILEGLNAAEGMEKYLGAKFPGAKRFSLEGGDALVPMMREILYRAGEAGTKEIVVGMAHRGRLNVLVNVLGKRPAELFDEFAGKHDEIQGSGDVKYHQGFSSDFETPGGNVHLALAFNPSHLEIVNPVVIGSVRARQDRRGCTDGLQVMPITIHGDSAITGQGIVQETFNMSQARGFKVGGSIRIVINNQVGFTTSNHEDVRSTEYCTDIAKMVQAPIFHVNADDPEAVAFISQLAVDYRNEFKRDVVIDLVCYRRHGHNEADEPSATQPLMYAKIKKHPTPRKIYADRLIEESSISADDVTGLVNTYRDSLDAGDCVVKEWRPMTLHTVDWTPYLNREWDESYQASMKLERLNNLAQKIVDIPESHKLQSRVAKIYKDRVSMANGEKPLDWGFAETLAYASILEDNKRVRITGQDSGRGTFFHRHAVLHNQNDGTTYLPLRNVADEQGEIDIIDSVLSEASVLAFEYGYATAEPGGLTIWEAQFGDFVNCAQVVIDQFLSSGEQKWGRLCGLTMLLPHGYEGQGPEHSSARLERFLQLCANHNMQVCVPSTPAQVYHMLRRQVVRPMRRPLVVMSPKSLLRHPLAVSSLDELANGGFQSVIGELDALDASKVDRVVFCSGKVYFELLDKRRKQEIENVAILRVEQLYPFPQEEMQAALAEYQHVKDFVWCQEEPQNQGAWYCSQHHFWAAIPAGAQLTYAGREASAAPACGYPALHARQQEELINSALKLS